MIGVIFVTYIFVKVVFKYVAPFIVGYVISILMEPLVKLFAGKKNSRGFASFICILLIISLLGGAGTWIIVKLIVEGRSFAADVPYYIRDAIQAFDKLKGSFNEQFLFVPDSMQSVIDGMGQALVSGLTGILSTGVKQGSVNIMLYIPQTFLSIMLCIISSFFFMRDKHHISKFIKGQFPLRLKDTAMAMKNGLLHALSGYFKAQLALMGITAIICISGLLLTRYPYALFVGLAIAVLDALPVFGVGTILWPWAAYSLLRGDYSRAIWLVAIYGVVFVARQILEPRILGEQIGIHPLIILMSIYIGLHIFGVVGLLLGPMLTVALKTILEIETVESV